MHGYKILYGTILTKMSISKKKLIIHGYRILHGGDLNETENLEKRKLCILSFGIEGLRNFLDVDHLLLGDLNTTEQKSAVLAGLPTLGFADLERSLAPRFVRGQTRSRIDLIYGNGVAQRLVTGSGISEDASVTQHRPAHLHVNKAAIALSFVAIIVAAVVGQRRPAIAAIAP